MEFYPYMKVKVFQLAIAGPNGNQGITVTGVGQSAEEAEADFEAKRLDMIRALSDKS